MLRSLPANPNERAERKELDVYSIPANTVYDLYKEIGSVLGKSVLIGGRALNILCQGTFRKTSDVDLLVEEDIGESQKSMLEDLGWKQDDSGVKLGKHHFRKELSGQYEGTVALDVNTLHGRDALTGLKKSRIMSNAILVTMPGHPSKTMLVASPEALIAMKLLAIENMKYTSSNSQEETDIAKHMEDIYRLFSEFYKSDSNAFADSLKKVKGFFKEKLNQKAFINSMNDILDSGRIFLEAYNSRMAKLTEALDTLEESRALEVSKSSEREARRLNSANPNSRVEFAFMVYRNDSAITDASRKNATVYKVLNEYFGGNYATFAKSLFSVLSSSKEGEYKNLKAMTRGEFLWLAQSAAKSGAEALPEYKEKSAASGEIFSAAVKLMFREITGEVYIPQNDISNASELMSRYWGTPEKYIGENWDHIVLSSQRFFQLDDGTRVAFTKPVLLRALRNIQIHS